MKRPTVLLAISSATIVVVIFWWLMSLSQAESNKAAGAIQASIAILALIGFFAGLKWRKSADGDDPHEGSAGLGASQRSVDLPMRRWAYQPLHGNTVDLWSHLEELDRAISFALPGCSLRWSAEGSLQRVSASTAEATRQSYESKAGISLPSRLWAHTSLDGDNRAGQISLSIDYPRGVTKRVEVIARGPAVGQIVLSPSFRELKHTT